MALKAKNPFFVEEGVVGVSPKALKEARTLKHGEKVPTRYGFIKKDRFVVSVNTACHAGLSYPPIEQPDYVVQYIDTERSKEEARRAFAEWLVNFSPFRSVFVTKDIDAIMKDNFIVASTDHPSNLMAGGIMATRIFSEHQNVGRVWYGLVKAGLHPSLAFYVAYDFKTEADERTLYPTSSSHTGCFDTNCTSREGLVNILMDKPVYLATSNYRQSNTYSSAQLLFAQRAAKTMRDEFTKRVNRLMDGSKADQATANPFTKPKPLEGSRWPFKEGCKALATVVMEEFKEELEKLNGKA